MINDIFEIELFICIEMDLAINNIKGWYAVNPNTQATHHILIYTLYRYYEIDYVNAQSYIYIYIYVCVCVCVCIFNQQTYANMHIHTKSACSVMVIVMGSGHGERSLTLCLGSLHFS